MNGTTFLGHLGDGFDPADDHRKDHTGEDHPGDPAGIVADHARNLLMRLVGLEHVAAAQRAEDAEDREHHREELAPRQPAFGKALGEVIHRPARDAAIGIFVTVFHAQRAFGEFRRHAHQRGEDHPERGPRPADADGDRHPAILPRPTVPESAVASA